MELCSAGIGQARYRSDGDPYLIPQWDDRAAMLVSIRLLAQDAIEPTPD